jgi:hypothetical protein
MEVNKRLASAADELNAAAVRLEESTKASNVEVHDGLRRAPFLNIMVSLTSEKLASYLKTSADSQEKRASEEIDAAKALVERVKATPPYPVPASKEAPVPIRKLTRLSEFADCEDLRDPNAELEQLRNACLSLLNNAESSRLAAQDHVAYIRFVAENLPKDETFELSPEEIRTFINGRGPTYGRGLAR